MIFAMTLANSGSILTAEDNGVGTVGFIGATGSITRSPVAVRAQGSEVVALAVGLGDLVLRLSGDQTSFVSGKTLYIDALSYAVSAADNTGTYNSGNDFTEVEWENEAPLSDGQTYVIRFE